MDGILGTGIVIFFTIAYLIYDHFRNRASPIRPFIATPEQKKRIAENKKMAEQYDSEQAEKKKMLGNRIQSITDQHIATLALQWVRNLDRDENGLALQWNRNPYQDKDGNWLMDSFSRDFGFFLEVLRNDELIASYPIDRRMLSILIENNVKVYFEKVGGERINSLITNHISVLTLKRDQTISHDDYGNLLIEKWNQEVNYFVDNVLRRDDLVAIYLDLSSEHLNQVFETVTNATTAYKIQQLESNAHLSVDIESLDPIAFEHHCAELLRNDGWNARVTQASGDQGIDVIATRGNVKAVFQCKKYAQPVGNGAVQEIVAGKQFEQADIAAVVSNATFTPSAKQLAGTTGVHLLHYSDLDGFAEKLGMA